MRTDSSGPGAMGLFISSFLSPCGFSLDSNFEDRRDETGISTPTAWPENALRIFALVLPTKRNNDKDDLESFTQGLFLVALNIVKIIHIFMVPFFLGFQPKGQTAAVGNVVESAMELAALFPPVAPNVHTQAGKPMSLSKRLRAWGQAELPPLLCYFFLHSFYSLGAASLFDRQLPLCFWLLILIYPSPCP